jgi:hypothetical protein
MKNTLWIFGDSFSWDYKIRKENNDPQLRYPGSNDQGWDYIQEHLNGKIFDSWGEQLSRNIGYNYINHASYQTKYKIENLWDGNCNDTVNLNLLNEFSSDFKKGDVVIVGLTDPTRSIWMDGDTAISLNAGQIETENFKDSINDYLIQLDNPYWLYNFLQKLKCFETLSEIVGFDLWYWDWGGQWDELILKKELPNDRWIFHHAHPNYKNYGNMIWEDYKAGPICWETNYENPDSHMGKVGHKIHADILTNYLLHKKPCLDFINFI